MDIEKKNHDHIFDVAIIGSGPAGLSAGLYAARASLDVVMFERIAAGGQLASAELIENYPGLPEGKEGFALAQQMYEHCLRFGVQEIGEEVTGVDLSDEIKIVRTPFGEYKTKSIIIATGASPRQLGIDLEEELQGKGVSYCASCDGNFFRDKDVMVTGGGNTAAMDTIYLSRVSRKVYLVHRRDKLKATAVYHDTINSLENVQPIWHATPTKLFAQEGKLAGVRVKHLQTGEEEDIEVEGLFVAVGTKPNTEFVEGLIEMDQFGYIIAGEDCKTSVPGVFVAGDVRTKVLRQVITAASDGAIAAEMAVEFLVS